MAEIMTLTTYSFFFFFFYNDVTFQRSTLVFFDEGNRKYSHSKLNHFYVFLCVYKLIETLLGSILVGDMTNEIAVCFIHPILK